jgi:hypothetical protein
MTLLRSTVRYDAAESKVRGVEVWMMRCETCMSSGRGSGWWELSLSNWNPTSGLVSCRACHNLARRKARRQTPEQRRANQRTYYYANRDERLAWRHAYHALHREEINRIRRLKYAAAKQQVVHQETLWELAADG